MLDTIRSLATPASRCASIHREDGQVMVEYSIILLLVAVVVVAVLSVFGGQVSSLFSEINANF